MIIMLSYKSLILFFAIYIILSIIPLTFVLAMGEGNIKESNNIISLPSPTLKGHVSVEEAIKRRRTRRSFSSDPLSIIEWGQLLWSAQGITSEGNLKKRAAPSAGALFPLDIYLVLGKNSLDPIGTGFFHYLPDHHALKRLSNKDFTKKIAEASLWQYWMAQASGMILITAEYPRITSKYENRGIRYSHIEAGHVAQNCFLQAESLGLSVGIVGAFEDQSLIDLLPIPEGHEPILIIPVGKKAKE
ncbi:SagB family peptide dehydrogenase [bacterium]|nr:SagB family peptide dehydrogenase [bacterium]